MTPLTNRPFERLLTVDEVADLLQVHPRTVRREIDRGKLIAVRLSQRVVRIKESTLRSYIGER